MKPRKPNTAQGVLITKTAASGYLWWYKAAEDAANSPATFVNLVAMAATLCGVAGGFAWARAFRRIKG